MSSPKTLCNHAMTSLTASSSVSLVFQQISRHWNVDRCVSPRRHSRIPSRRVLPANPQSSRSTFCKHSKSWEPCQIVSKNPCHSKSNAEIPKPPCPRLPCPWRELRPNRIVASRAQTQSVLVARHPKEQSHGNGSGSNGRRIYRVILMRLRNKL